MEWAFVFVVLIYCKIVYPYMMFNVAKPFGNLFHTQDSISTLMILYPIFNGVSRIFWGALLDFFNFKTLFLILIILSVI